MINFDETIHDFLIILYIDNIMTSVILGLIHCIREVIVTIWHQGSTFSIASGGKINVYSLFFYFYQASISESDVGEIFGLINLI